ncbi:hypothetical protein ACEZDB_35685 [Streptacidiphilus sp. N1-3]|uniref:SMODS and SLOG-associating 2TM effector domain-containing protein n=1 Tax=Streptacidiphilus alkalitolerans TaxID=3342712 RepID=A0ABV6XD56_9ACTN
MTAIIAFTAFLWSGTSRTSGSWAPPTWIWIVVACCAALVAFGLCYFFVVGSRQDQALRRAAEERAVAQAKVAEQHLAELKTVTPLATLLELNQAQIDEYHRIATDQADRSFRSSQRAMGLGLLVVVGCFAGGIYLHTGQAKVFMGAIAVVGSALSAYLNRTYLHMYGQTLSQLNRYFEQPVLTGYYLTAERLAQGLSDDPESTVRQRIVDQVLAASAQMSKVSARSDTGGKPPKRRRRGAAQPPADPE